MNFKNETDVTQILQGAKAWLAFNITQDSITSLSDSALKAGVKRVVFTMELPPNRINDTIIPEFDSAVLAFQTNGGSFTGIRHGTIIPGKFLRLYNTHNQT